MTEQDADINPALSPAPPAMQSLPPSPARQNADDLAWPQRALLMAAICAVAALLFHWLTDIETTYIGNKLVSPPQWGVADGKLTPLRQALAVFVGITTLAFVLTVELRRWWWSIVFAVGWGAVIASVGFFTAAYNHNEDLFDFPFFAGVFAVLLAAPLFQAARDLGKRAFPYARTHNHIWTDAVIGAAALAFTGISFALMHLMSELFSLVGLDFLKDLLRKEWFGWLLGGLAFGTAIGILRERDALVSTLQRLAMVVLSVLAPVLAVGLGLFLLSLPFTGLQRLWDTTQATTPILLVCAAGAFVLANAVIGNGIEDRTENRILRWAALALALFILPLAIIAAISMGLRISQYGWTPARIWGIIVVAVALGYGAAYLFAVVRGRSTWDDTARKMNIQGALIMCAVALFLALPIIDFGSISAKDQLARLRSGTIPAHKFDWAAMAFDFGPKGRAILEELASKGNAKQKEQARTALAAKQRWDINRSGLRADLDDLPLEERLVFQQTVPDRSIQSELVAALRQNATCVYGPCHVRLIHPDSWIAFGRTDKEGPLRATLMTRLTASDKPFWQSQTLYLQEKNPAAAKRDLARDVRDITASPQSRIELLPVPRYRVVIDGKPTESFVED